MREKGSITVFLSFTFLLIMSLILVLLEGARSRAAAAVADMQMTACVESMLGEYYRPLYDKYNVFGIDTAFGGKTPDIETFEETMAEFAGTGSLGIRVDDCKITATRPFLTKDGKAFFKQVTEFEKYCAVVDTLEGVLSKLKILSKESEVYKIYERQMEIEDKLAIIDRNTLVMMDKVDGLVCNGATIGEVHEMFVKAFMTREIDPVGAGINNPDIWPLLQDKYFSPKAFVDNAGQKLEAAYPEAEERDEVRLELNLLYEQREALNNSIDSKNEQLNNIIEALSSTEDESDEDDDSDGESNDFGEEDDKSEEEASETDCSDNSSEESDTDEETDDDSDDEVEAEEPEEVKQLRNELSGLYESLNELCQKISLREEKIKTLNDSINDLVLTASIQTDELMRGVSGCLHEARDAVKLIEDDRKIVDETRPLIEAFSEILESSGDILSKETYDSMKATLTKMRRYTGMDGSSPDFEIMEDTLKTDVGILAKMETDAFISSEVAVATQKEVTTGDLKKWSDRLEEIKAGIESFSYDKLVFDYSEMRPDRILCEIGDGVKRTLAKGFLTLLMDEDQISGKKISVRTRPSNMMNAPKPVQSDVQEVLDSELGKESGAESFVRADAGGMALGAGEILDDNESDLMDKLLLILYISEHFGDKTEKSKTAQSALAYEQEYILCGNRSDVENLGQIASYIMFARMAAAGAYVLTNGSLHTRATEIASSLVGFTSLHFLTAIVKYMILFAWTSEQALVETAAIINEKKVPILTTSASYCIDTFDIAAITAEGLKEKVRNFHESEVSLSYGDYLFMFMLGESCEELCLRAMDMIEENMRWAYDDNFLLSNCITGFDTTMEFTCPSRYIGIFDGLYADTDTPSGYGFVRSDSVDY